MVKGNFNQDLEDVTVIFLMVKLTANVGVVYRNHCVLPSIRPSLFLLIANSAK